MKKQKGAKGDILTFRQRAILPLLVSGETIEEACRVASVNRTTFYRWMRQPHFKDALTSARDEAFVGAMARLKSTLTQAADTLVSLLQSNDENIKLRTADRVVTHALRISEIEDLQKRLEELERRLGGRVA